MVQRLVGGAASVSELARPFDMALPSVVQHLGVLEAAVLGILVTSILGRFMVYRNWATLNQQSLPFEMIRDLYPRFEGALPRTLGIDPILAFPTAVFLMTFMAFFIGVFLQLLWEDLPITEPL